MNDTLLWYTTRGAGAVSLLLLSAVVALGVLTAVRFEAPGWPRFLTAAFHRNLSLTAVVFLALHVVTAVTDPYAHLGLTVALVPFTSWYRTLWVGLGTIAARLGATHLVYVACDATALARDAKALLAADFRPLTLQLVEMFPQTRHVEAVMGFSRAG